MIEKLLDRLKAIKRSYDLSLKIHQLSLEFPKMEQFELAHQIRRCSKSVCVNLVEGFGKDESEKEKKRFVRIAIGSNDELKLWLLYARDLGYVDEKTYRDVSEEAEEIGRMLYGLRKKLEA